VAKKDVFFTLKPFKYTSNMSKKFPGGVATGDAVQAIFNDAKENEYALPAVNVVNSHTVNAVLERQPPK
jgi:hypothetical protein